MTEAKDEEDKPFKCKQCKESFMTDDRLQVHNHNHKLSNLKVNTGGKRSLLPEQTPTPTKFLESNYDPFDSFAAEMRNNGGDTPATSKPRLIISPTLHTPVASLVSPVFPTLLTSSSHGTLHTPGSAMDSPIFPVPKLSPVPGAISLSNKTADLLRNLPQHAPIDLQTILRTGLGQMSQQVKQEPSSPKSESRKMIVERIRKRADVPSTVSSDGEMDTISSSSRKRFPSEMNGQIDEKRRKFLERNRAAAQRCREKRKQWINNLQSEKFAIQEENNKLHIEVHNLRQEVMNLKRLLLQHKDCPVTKARKDVKLEQSILPHPFPSVSENSEIKRPSPSKPQPQHPLRMRAPRDSNGSDAGAGNPSSLDIKPTSLSTDPLGPLLDGLITKDGFSRSKFSPLFNPISNLPRSPIVGLSPFSLGPNFGLMQMGTSVEPQYTITSLDSRNDKNRGVAVSKDGGSPGGQENPCPDVGNGLVVIREALSNCKT